VNVSAASNLNKLAPLTVETAAVSKGALERNSQTTSSVPPRTGSRGEGSQSSSNDFSKTLSEKRQSVKPSEKEQSGHSLSDSKIRSQHREASTDESRNKTSQLPNQSTHKPARESHAEVPNKTLEEQMSSEEMKSLQVRSPAQQTNTGVAADLMEDAPIEDAQVVEDFVEEVERELGVPSFLVLAAMSQLDPNTLADDPERGVDELSQSLQLSGDDTENLAEMYNKMLSRMATKDFDGFLSDKDLVANMDVQDARFAKQQRQLGELTGLQNNFFVDAKLSQNAPKASDETLVIRTTPQVASVVSGKNGMAEVASGGSGVQPSTLMAAAAVTGGKTIQDLDHMGDLEIESLEVESVAPSEFEESLNLNDKKVLLNETAGGRQSIMNVRAKNNYLRAAGGNGGATPMSSEAGGAENLNGLDQATEAKLNELLTKLNANLQDLSESPQSETFDLGESGLTSNAAGSAEGIDGETAIINVSHAKPMAVGGAGEILSSRTDFRVASLEEQYQNIQQVMDKARVLANQGGGEMKVKLAPEGLGNVDLKVKVESGQVQVDLLTDTPEAKKLIESNLGDLKSNLELHKLSLDKFKVNTADRAETQPDLNRDTGRENAREFLGSFKDFNQSFREGFFGIPQREGIDRVGDEAAQKKPEDIRPANRPRNQNGIHLVA